MTLRHYELTNEQWEQIKGFWRDEGVLLTIFQELNTEPDFENLSIVPVPKKGHKS